MESAFYNDVIYKYTAVSQHISWLLEQSTPWIIYCPTDGLFGSMLYLSHGSIRLLICIHLEVAASDKVGQLQQPFI